MKEIDSNRHAWAQIAEDHYHAYKKRFIEDQQYLNTHIKKELGNLKGKKIIHLQCNVGADTILLAKIAKSVVGVDLVPENIFYAKQLAEDLNINNVEFFASDVMQLIEKQVEKYDVVFVSEGSIGWLPDLSVWGKIVRKLLTNDGFLYVFDSHPFFLMTDPKKLANNNVEIMYPYFSKVPDVDNSIGGYASEPKIGVKAFFWMYTISDLINSLTSAGLHIEYFNEFTENFYNSGGMRSIEKSGLFNYDYNNDMFPMSFSLKASVYKDK